jgi:hypothetical protein
MIGEMSSIEENETLGLIDPRANYQPFWLKVGVQGEA